MRVHPSFIQSHARTIAHVISCNNVNMNVMPQSRRNLTLLENFFMQLYFCSDNHTFRAILLKGKIANSSFTDSTPLNFCHLEHPDTWNPPPPLWHCENVQQPDSSKSCKLSWNSKTSLCRWKVHLRPAPESTPEIWQTHSLHACLYCCIAEYNGKIRGLLWSSVRSGQVFMLPAFFAICSLINAAAEVALPVMCRVGIGIPPPPTSYTKLGQRITRY